MPITTRTLPLAAIALASVGLGVSALSGDAGSSASTPAPKPPEVRSGPIACALDVTPGLFGLTFAGKAEALQDVAGTYDLTIRKSGRSGSAVIRQGGEFRLRAGEAETLGEATLSGDPSEFDASLTVDVGGKRFTCRPRGAVEL